MAFLPFEERPLEKWIIAFFRAIYSPTLYSWKRGDVTEKLFQDEPLEETVSTKIEEDVTKYLGTKKIETPLSKLENAEKGFLSGLTSLFSSLIPQTQPATAVAPAVTPTQTDAPPPAQSPFQVPVTPMVKIAQEERPRVVVEEAARFQTSQVAPILAGNEMISTRQALFSPEAAPPNPPVTPNVVVGQVVDEERKIIEGAIMEIKDSAGRPIRALKSNKLGHFIIVTPLDSGRYDIVTEKEGFEFTPVSFEAVGELIPPILVQGRRLLNEVTAAA